MKTHLWFEVVIWAFQWHFLRHQCFSCCTLPTNFSVYLSAFKCRQRQSRLISLSSIHLWAKISNCQHFQKLFENKTFPKDKSNPKLTALNFAIYSILLKTSSHFVNVSLQNVSLSIRGTNCYCVSTFLFRMQKAKS